MTAVIPTVTLPALSTTKMLAGIVGILVFGITLSMATTTDPTWWLLYFSQLGTLGDFSAAIFNGTMMLCGLLFLAFSVRLYRDLRAHVGRSRSHRSGPAILATAFASIGVHLTIVGIVPINTVTALHEQGASGMVLSFAGVLVGSPLVVRGVGKHLRMTSIPVTVLLVVGGTAMALGKINLAAFELVAFGTMFAWILLFAAALRTYANRDAATSGAAAREGAHRTQSSVPDIHERLTALRSAPMVTLSPTIAARRSAPTRRGPAVLPRAHDAAHVRTSAYPMSVRPESRTIRLRVSGSSAVAVAPLVLAA